MLSQIHKKFHKSQLAFLLLTLATPVFADDFEINLKDEKTLLVSSGGTTISINASKAWEAVEGAAADTYTFEGDVQIGDFSMSAVTASIGPNGGGFSTGAGLELGELSLSAGELTFGLMRGDQLENIFDLPDAIGNLDSDDIVLYTAISSAIGLEIGDKTEISLPSPVDIGAALLVEFNSGMLYYEGPIPSPTQIADGANSFLKSASSSDDSGGMLSGAFGFSTKDAFTFESEIDLYQSSSDEPNVEEFNANVVMIGEFDLADFASVEGQLFLDTSKGRLGINSAATVAYDLFDATASMNIADASFVVDKAGVRFGFDLNSAADAISMPGELDNIFTFMLPMLNAGASAYGLAKSNADFLIDLEAQDVSITGIDGSDASLSLSPSGLEVAAKFNLDGVGKVNVSGDITEKKCELTADKIKIFDLWEIEDASIKPCKMAENAAYEFAGEMKVLGVSATVSGLSNASNSAISALDRDYSFNEKFAIEEKFGVSGSGIAGGYVKLKAEGSVEATIAANGAVSGDVEMDASAKFCGKVSIAGKKIKKCTTTESGISPNFSIDSNDLDGCFQFSASKKILGKTFKIDDNDICPWGSYKSSGADYDSTESSEDGDEGLVVYLRNVNTDKYISRKDDYDAPLYVSDSSTSDDALMTLVYPANSSEDNCISDGSRIGIRVGDGTAGDHYMRQKKDKYNWLNAGAGDYYDTQRQFDIYEVKMADNCLSHGDIIRIRDAKYHRFWQTNASLLRGHSSDANNKDQQWEVIVEIAD